MGKGKAKTTFFCQECGYESIKWLGKCPGCGSWNCFVEELQPAKQQQDHLRQLLPQSKPEKLEDISFDETMRMHTGIGELDRVLGGGLVPGELVLLSGDPGIGKSTLTMQLAGKMSHVGPVMYISGEESGQQLKMRAQRLGVVNGQLSVLTENNLEQIEYHLNQIQPKIVILDSIQTVFLPEISSAPGSVSQLRECTNRVLQWAKVLGISVVLVGHVTKDGAVAGPRVLEHMVDAVLYFEGDRQYQYRILRALKNRFGSTNEIGVFEMREQGLAEIINPSVLFLSDRKEDPSGAVVVPCMEGSRPVLIELQALVAPCFSGQPRRMPTGVDYNRLAMISAVLEKRVGMKIGGQDIYVNLAGGMRVDEPAIDLGIMAALASGFTGKTIPRDLIVLGEVGLTGELRGVPQMEKRLAEAEKLGFKTAIIPQSNMTQNIVDTTMQLIGCQYVGEALEHILGGVANG